jgi:hypothetical protein
VPLKRPRLSDRSRRMGLFLPVTVSGSDLTGRSFTEATRTLNISGGGLAFETRRRLEVGSRLLLEVRIPPRLPTISGGATVPGQGRGVRVQVRRTAWPTWGCASWKAKAGRAAAPVAIPVSDVPPASFMVRAKLRAGSPS